MSQFEAQSWLAESLALRLDQDQQDFLVRLVEDWAITFYRLTVDSSDDAGVSNSDISAVAAAVSFERLAVLFDSPLANGIAPVVRRLFALLAGDEELGFAEWTLRQEGPTFVFNEQEIETTALAALRWSQQQTEHQSLVGQMRVRGKWHLSSNDPSIEAPAIEVSVPYLSLMAIASESDLELVMSQLEIGLEMVDPVLLNDFQRIRSEAKSDSDSVTSLIGARSKFADQSMTSIALDLERDLAHGVRRIRSKPHPVFEDWLLHPKRDKASTRRTDITNVAGIGQVPTTAFQAAVVLGSSTELTGHFEKVAQLHLQSDQPIGRALEFSSKLAVGAVDSFASLYSLAVTAYLLDGVSSDEERPLRDQYLQWFRRFVIGQLSGLVDDNGLREVRDPRLGIAYSLSSRLGIHAASSSAHLESLILRHDNDLALVSSAWCNHALIAGTRILYFQFDKSRNIDEFVADLRTSCVHLGLPVESAGYTGDIYNPFLWGPGLLNVEPWFLLHFLDISWQDLAGDDTGVPIWWSPTVVDLLKKISTMDEPIEAETIFPANAQNGFRIKMSLTPSEFAKKLLERANASSS